MVVACTLSIQRPNHGVQQLHIPLLISLIWTLCHRDNGVGSLLGGFADSL
jgi:hypothetical protein